MPAAKTQKNLSAWTAAKTHTVTCPSGFECDIQVPNLPSLVKSGKIPNTLIDAALKAANTQTSGGQAKAPSQEDLEAQDDFNRKLVTLTVVEPALTDEDVDSIPFEDVEMLVEIAMRQRDVDALYRHIGGLHKSDEWREFRGLGERDSTTEGL